MRHLYRLTRRNGIRRIKASSVRRQLRYALKGAPPELRDLVLNHIKIAYWNTNVNLVRVAGRGKYDGKWFEYGTLSRTEGYLIDTALRDGDIEDMLRDWIYGYW